jgi:predicted MFS family arabinose efflux permease
LVLSHGLLEDAESGPVTRSLNLLFAVASVLAVANVYFAQPLLESMAHDLNVAESTIGIVVTVTQLGYALGLMFIVPLGDLVDRRRLVVSQLIISSIALVVVSRAPTIAVLLSGMVVIGLAAVVVQVLVAFAATLASAADRGRSVGTVTSGVVLGILLARFVSGILADLGGWRAVYLTSGCLTLAMAGVLHLVLPVQQAPVAGRSYAKLLRSVYSLFASERLLRVRAGLALLIFASFSVLWTSIVLPLSAAPRSLSHTQVGLFGLAGVAGALAASRAGKWADQGHGQRTTGVALALLLLSWLPTAFLEQSLLGLVAGVVLLDLAVQAVHVTNQTMIFAARPDAHSRLVAGYMVFYSIGSALGAITATSVYAAAGWAWVCVLGAFFSGLALLLWAATRHVTAPSLERS